LLKDFTVKRVLLPVLLFFTTSSCLADDDEPRHVPSLKSYAKAKCYRKQVPSLMTYAAIAVATPIPNTIVGQHNPELNGILEVLSEGHPHHLRFEAACEILRNFYGPKAPMKFGSTDCPDMAHFVIAHKLVTPNEALASAEKNKLQRTIMELRACGAQTLPGITLGRGEFF
jgi:hypothetical protein